MTKIRASVRIENSNDRALYEAGRIPKRKVRSRDVEAVVDTDAMMTVLPQDLVPILGLSPMEMGRAGPLTLTVVGRSMHLDCLVGPHGCEVRVGQMVMNALDLVCDPGKRTLTVRLESPFRPTLKLKKLEAVPA